MPRVSEFRGIRAIAQLLADREHEDQGKPLVDFDTLDETTRRRYADRAIKIWGEIKNVLD